MTVAKACKKPRSDDWATDGCPSQTSTAARLSVRAPKNLDIVGQQGGSDTTLAASSMLIDQRPPTTLI